MSSDSLAARGAPWGVRLIREDLDRGIYSVVLLDPSTWTRVGPYLLAFESVDAAFGWLCGVADIDTAHWSMGHLDRGLFVEGSAEPRLWQAMLSMLEHCAHVHPVHAERSVMELPDPSDAATISRYDIDHDRRTLLALSAALSAHRDELGHPFDADEEDPVEVVCAWVDDFGSVVHTVQYRTVVDAGVRDRFERVDGAWAPDAQEVTTDAVEYVIEPFAAGMLVRMVDAGVEIHEGFAVLGEQDPAGPVSFDDLPDGFVSYLSRAADLAEELDAMDAAPGLGEWVQVVRSRTSTPLGPFLTTAANWICAVHANDRELSCSPLPQADEGIESTAPELPADLPEPTPQGPDDGWTRLIEFLAALIALTDGTVQLAARTEHHPDGQARVVLRRRDGEPTTLEIERSTLAGDPPVVGPEDAAPGDLAALMVETLRHGYRVTTGDPFTFAADHVTEQMLAGEFGRRFELRGGRDIRAILREGIRFPADLA